MDLNEAETLLKYGWIPRIKTVKGRNYITLRKGENERSLGPYEKEYWSKIYKLSEVKLKPNIVEIEDLKDAMAKTNNTIAELRAELEKLKGEKAFEDLGRLKEDVAKIKVSFDYLEYTAKWRVLMDRPEYSCKLLGKDGYCTRWFWDEEQRFRLQKQDNRGKWHDSVREHPRICVACPIFEPNKEEQQ